MIKAVFLDFYGTIVEEDDYFIRKIINKICQSSKSDCIPESVGCYWYAKFQDLCNSSYNKNFVTQKKIESLSLKKTIGKFKSTENYLELSEILFQYWQKPKIFPEANKFFDENITPICIVSNIDNFELEEALRFHDISVQEIVTSEKAKSYKPRSEMFEMALKKMNCKPSEVLHVGDSYSSDILGAKKLGIKTAWINRYNRNINKQDYDYKIMNLTQILEIISNNTF